MLQGVGAICLPDVDLAVEGRGSGETLLLVHGFGGDRGLWDGVWPALSSGRHALRYDLRGFGQSRETGRRPFSHARDLEGLLDALEIDRCDLLGVSMGGAIALHFALDHPERVRRLALVSPGLAAWEWSDEWRARWTPILEAARAGDLDRARELWWTHPLFDTTRQIPAAAAQLRAAIDGYSGRHWAEPEREEPVLPDVERLHLLAPPTLLLTGARDLPDFRLIADIVEAAAPRVSRKDYEDAGHLLHLERPQAFVDHVRDFLGNGGDAARV